MNEVPKSNLKRAIEAQHGGTATLIQSLPVKETFDGKMVWEWNRSRFPNPWPSQGD
jgi:hypothetical protein